MKQKRYHIDVKFDTVENTSDTLIWHNTFNIVFQQVHNFIIIPIRTEIS